MPKPPPPKIVPSTGTSFPVARHSLFADAPEVGPGGQSHLFDPGPTQWQERGATERVPPSRRRWDEMRPTSAAKGAGTTREEVRGLLKGEGVSTAGAIERVRDAWQRASAKAEAAGKKRPEGQAFYAREQAGRFDDDAKTFRVPYHVVVAANAIMSPQMALASPKGYQTNREAAWRVLHHVLSGKEGVPTHKGLGLHANVNKATEMIRQYKESGVHPLDAVDAAGKKLLSGPKVEAYYSNYMNPDRTTTDIQHSRVLFGPTVRSTMSDEEKATSKELVKKFGKDSPEVAKSLTKSPAEQLLERAGVHEWAQHVTEGAAKQLGVTPAEVQSVVWHQVKHDRGGMSKPAAELKPLFASRAKPPKPDVQLQFDFPDERKQKKAKKPRASVNPNLSGAQFGSNEATG